MKTLYDLLGAHPNDDAERLRSAFRKAVKANHPDHHSDDREASNRFRRIVEAYDILRDANQRAAYDRLLEFERRQRRLKLRRTIFSYMYDAVAAAGLASVLLAGYALITHISKISVEELVWSKARGSTVAAVHQQGKLAGISAPEMPIMVPVPEIMASPGNDADAPGVTNGGTGSSTTAQDTDAAKVDNTAAIDQTLATITAYRPDGDPQPELFDDDKTRSSDVHLSSQQKVDEVLELSLPDVPTGGDKRDIAAQDKRDIGAHDVKPPETKLLRKPRMEAKREARSHAPFRQALLENRSTPACSGPPRCSTDTPLFGVGF
jgi:DnaJ-like protein